MVVEWHLDSCQCIILYGKDIQYIDYIQKCQEHKSLSGEALLTAVRTHNGKYNTENKIQSRQNEHKRIRALGKPIKKPKLKEKKKKKK